MSSVPSSVTAVGLFRHPDQGVLEALKWLALLCMLVDHVGALAFDQLKFSACYHAGRIAYPLFAMVLAARLAEHARTRGPVGLDFVWRLLRWALVSALPYVFATGRAWPLDIFFTLALGAALCRLSDCDCRFSARVALHFLAVTASFACDYLTPGVYLLPALYRLQRQPSLGPALGVLACAAALSLLNASSATLLPFALMPLAHLLRVHWPRFPALIFYAAYPLHLAVLAAWRLLL